MHCLVCQKKVKSLSGLILHLRVHGINRKTYYDMFFKTKNEGMCLVCGKETKFDRGKYASYCRGCSNKDPLIKDKKRQTCILNHGVSSPLQSKLICDKVKNTCQLRYGVNNPNQLICVKKKKKETSLKRYGVENPSQSKEVQNKYKKTCLNRYHVTNPFSLAIIKEKIRLTCLKKYGVDHPSKSKMIQDKIKRTNLKRFGFKNPSQSPNIKLRKRRTCLKHWGSNYFVSSDAGKLMARNSAIDRIEKQYLNDEPLMPCIGHQERLCLNELQNVIEFDIIRNPRLFGYFPDGYIKELNVVIEFDERHHFIDEWITYLDSDIEKDRIYKQNGLFVFRIKKRDWEQIKNKIIERFRCKMKELKNDY